MNKIFGYVRVSSKDQNEERQIIALKQFPVEEEYIYIDKISGKDFNRPKYKKMLKELEEKDVLVVKSIDRLGRNYSEILDQWRFLTKEKKIYLVVIDMPLLDTRKNQDLMGTLIADIVLQLLSYVAETERDNIKQRQAEGIAAAKARGVKFGRPKKDVPKEFKNVYNKWRRQEISGRSAAKELNICYQTFIKWTKEEEKKNIHIFPKCEKR